MLTAKSCGCKPCGHSQTLLWLLASLPIDAATVLCFTTPFIEQAGNPKQAVQWLEESAQRRLASGDQAVRRSLS